MRSTLERAGTKEAMEAPKRPISIRFNDLGSAIVKPNDQLQVINRCIIPGAKKTILTFGRHSNPEVIEDNTSIINLFPNSSSSDGGKISREVFRIESNNNNGNKKTRLKLLSTLNSIRIVKASEPQNPLILQNHESTLADVEAGDTIEIYHHNISIGIEKPLFKCVWEPNKLTELFQKETGVKIIPYPGQEFEYNTLIPVSVNKFLNDHPKLLHHPIGMAFKSIMDLANNPTHPASKGLLQALKNNTQIGRIFIPTDINYTEDLEAHNHLVQSGGISMLSPKFKFTDQIRIKNLAHQPVKLQIGDIEIFSGHCGKAVRSYSIVANKSSNQAITIIDLTKNAPVIIPPRQKSAFKGDFVIQSEAVDKQSYDYIFVSRRANRKLKPDKANEFFEQVGYTLNEVGLITDDILLKDPSDVIKPPDSPTDVGTLREQAKKAEEVDGNPESNLPKTPQFIELKHRSKVFSIAVDMVGFKDLREILATCPVLADEFLTGMNAIMEVAKSFVTLKLFPNTKNIEQLSRRVDGDGSFGLFSIESKSSNDISIQYSDEELKCVMMACTIPHLHNIAFKFISGRLNFGDFVHFECIRDPILFAFFKHNERLLESTRINYLRIKSNYPNMPELTFRYGFASGESILTKTPEIYNYTDDPRISKNLETAYRFPEIEYNSKGVPLDTPVEVSDAFQASVKANKKEFPNLCKDHDFGIEADVYTILKSSLYKVEAENLDSLIQKHESESNYFVNPETPIVTGSSKTTTKNVRAVITNSAEMYKLVKSIIRSLKE